jgi:hypothetical protein
VGSAARPHLAEAARPGWSPRHSHHQQPDRQLLSTRPEQADQRTPAGYAARSMTSAESAFGVCASARGIAVAVTPGNNGEPAPPRLACAWRYGRTDVRLGAKTGALPRRACRARRRAGAIGPASLCAEQNSQHCRHHAQRGSRRRHLGALQAPVTLPTQPGEITTATGATSPKLTVCTSSRSHPQNHAAAEPAGPAHCREASVTGSDGEASCLVTKPEAVPASGRRRPCQQSSPAAGPYPD